MFDIILKGISTTETRINKLSYLIILVVCIAASILIGTMLYMYIDKPEETIELYEGIVDLIFGGIILIATVNRLHDMNKSGWYALLQLIPIVNLGVIIWLLLGDGTEGKNKYGENPLKILKK